MSGTVETAIDNAIQTLHGFRPGVMRQHAGTAGARQALAFAGVVEHAQNLAHVSIGVVGDEEMLFVHCIHTAGGDAALPHCESGVILNPAWILWTAA